MKKIFEEYGGVIVTAIAIVALIGVVVFLTGGDGGGVIGNALQRQVSSLAQGPGDSDGSLDDSISGTVPPAGSGNTPSHTYTLEEIEANEYLYAIGATKAEYVVVAFNEDYSVATVTKNGAESDGVIKDYTGYDDGENFSPLTNHADTLKKVNFKEGITAIGSEICLSNSNLTTVSLPESLNTIGRQAFFECSDLSSLSVPDSVSSIGMGAFGYCAFASFVLPDSLTNIEYGLFTNCDSLSNIVIPNSVTYIDDYVFGDCDALEVIVIPESVTGIHELAFQDTVCFTTIKGVAGSYAETFANLKRYTFVAV